MTSPTPERDEAYVAYADTLPVYLAFSEALSLVKIGFSSNIRQRLGSLITDRPDAQRLVLVGWAIGGPRLESELHDRFASSRERGEWFHPDPAMADFIAEECEEAEPPIYSGGPFRVSSAGYWAARRRLAATYLTDRVVWDFGDGRELRAREVVNSMDITPELEALISGDSQRAAS